ncbi:MAG TPA: thioesterase family protein [Candidatus Limnocylindrales bacterium]|nr:thioesterase family protein [Candidatus Limnocylindrales bacterium]
MLDPVGWPEPDAPGEETPTELDPGLTGGPDRPVEGIDNGYVAGYRVRFDEAGPDGRIRTSALLRYAQDVAWRHSEFLGFDRRWYTERGRWWVVRAVDLEVLAPIPMGRTLRVSTAVVGHRRIWARRLGECRLADGTLAAIVTTDWVILDDRGRLVRIPPDFGLSFSNPELPGDIARVEQPEPPPDVHGLELRVRPADLDPMGHVNNAVYVDWLEEALASAGLTSATSDLPRGCRVEYRASAAPGDEVAIRTWIDDRAWHVRMTRDGDPAELARAKGPLPAAT